jgi:hypothetical protein
MALEKTVIEVPFARGQNQKPGPEVAEMDVPYLLRNMELRKGTTYVKREGRASFSTTVLGPGALLPSFGAIGRLATREDELVALCENTGTWGSAGGAGNAGDTVFSYSETMAGWKAFGKIGRPTSDVIEASPPTGTDLSASDSYVIDGYLMTVHGRDTGVHATVTDLRTGTRVLNNERIAVGLDKPMAFGLGTKFYLFGLDGSTNSLVGYVYDTTAHNSGFGTVVSLASVGTTANNQGFDVTTDGTNLYFSYHHISGGVAEIRVIKYSPTLANLFVATTVRTATSGQGGQNSISCNAGAVAIFYCVFTGAAQVLELKRLTNNTTPTIGSAVLVSASEPLLRTVRNVSISATSGYVFWDRIYSAATENPAGLNGTGTPTKVLWTDVGGTQATPTVGTTHTAINLYLWAEPFLISSRLYLPVLATRFNPPGSGPGAMGYYKGAYLTEVSTLATTNATATLMPVAANFLDVVGQYPGRKVGIQDGKAYATLARRQHNPFDPDGQNRYVEYPVVSTIAYDFSDRQRWQPANHKHYLSFSGALPYMFDGQNVHEVGFAWRPEIGEVALAAGGALTSGDTYTYRLTFEFRDHAGNRQHSQVNFAVEGIANPSAGNLSAVISASICSLSMKGDFASYFPGHLYLVLWRGTAAQTAAGEFVRVQEQRFFPYDTSNVTFTDAASDASLDTAERLYIFGNELENTTAPPCRVMFQHRDRLWAYNTETKSLWYTKPLTAERGIEWSLSQQVPVPDDVVAGASLEDSAVFFTRKQVFAIRGDGPGSTGTPVDAFSRLELVNADIGCNEPCAAWRAPPGVFFRSDQGIWLVTRAFQFEFIGAPIEEETKDLDYCAGGVVDARKGCFRLYYARLTHPYAEESAYCANYWYDTARWSLDDFEGDSLVSAVNWKGDSVFADRSEVWELGTGIYYDDTLNGFYPQTVTMHWARFGNLTSFKRLWRVLVACKMFSLTGLRVTVARDYDDGASDSWEFLESDVDTDPGVLRVHQRVQKVVAVRVTIEEFRPDGVTDFPAQGFELYGLGFELGMKRGAAKLGAERST